MRIKCGHMNLSMANPASRPALALRHAAAVFAADRPGKDGDSDVRPTITGQKRFFIYGDIKGKLYG